MPRTLPQRAIVTARIPNRPARLAHEPYADPLDPRFPQPVRIVLCPRPGAAPMSEQHLTEADDTLDESKFVTFEGSPFQLYQPYPPAGDQPTAIDTLVEGVEDGLVVPDAARRDRLRQDLHDGQHDRAARPPGHRVRAEQDARRAALLGVPRVLPAQCGRVLRFVLRLLPAGSVRAAARPVHREGLVDQRAHRADAAVGHQEPDGAARRGDRRRRCRRSTVSAIRPNITR